MSRRTLWAIVIVGGLALLLVPLLMRSLFLGYSSRSYQPPDIPALSVAATPRPTATPALLDPVHFDNQPGMPVGPVVVDLAHGNRLNRSNFQPLAAALADLGVGLHFWISEVDVLALDGFFDYPDQSDDLAQLLEDASALVVVSPFFLWSSEETAIVERFVADGGRLLLISDPDVTGDMARDINSLGEPFGVVFNDDYLYDTVENDENFVHVFLDRFVASATDLADAKIAFYGARSISGDVEEQAFSGQTTLSSLRTGLSGFATMVLAGQEANESAGRVLAMSDFDVMTEPYVSRHDNARMTTFVAEFLAGGVRENTATDFPAYLGKEVALVFGSSSSVDAELLRQGAKLQDYLEESGRSLRLTSASVMSGTDSSPGDGQLDIVYLADYDSANGDSGVLASLGLRLVEKVVSTPTSEEASADATPTPEILSIDVSAVLSATTPGAEESTAVTLATSTAPTQTVDVTDTVQITLPASVNAPDQLAPAPTATPSPTPTPEIERYIETEDGLRLLASETILIDQSQADGTNRRVAVLGNNSEAIGIGIARMLTRDYDGCFTSSDRIFCSFEGNGKPDKPNGSSTGDDGADADTEQGVENGERAAEATPTAGGDSLPNTSASILLIDDNRRADVAEPSEADSYLKHLTQMGFQPDLWSTAPDDAPELEDMLAYDWVIWSGGDYELSGPDLPDLQHIFDFLNEGGRMTISSRRPFFGASIEDPSVIVDVVIDEEIRDLTEGLPAEPIVLPNGLPPVAPLAVESDSEDQALVALRRGPDSNDANSPLLFVVTDDSEGEEAKGARLSVMGMSLSWLPDEVEAQLVANLAEWMLAPNPLALGPRPRRESAWLAPPSVSGR